MEEYQIVNEHVQSFIDSLEQEENPFLYELECRAHATHVPIIRKATKSLLRYLLCSRKPRKILEIGTAIGYSALVMAMCNEACQIDTIERNEGRYEQAKRNVANSECKERIHLYFGDAIEILKNMDGNYDFIFMDAAKAQYGAFWNECERLLSLDGLLVCDNILQNGAVAESRYAVTRRDRTVHKRMREFLYNCKRNDRLNTVILPMGDGVLLVEKKEKH